MLPSLSLTSSPNSATVKVHKATSELLIAPDWTINMEICDSVNSDHWMAKEVIKSVKKRLQHKSPRVQMLTLTLLETMVKNCGDHIHFHIAERKILDEMIKIVKKMTDMQVRSKILLLLDSWQEAFGGPGGKHMQYYWAYDELRRSGVQFPQRSLATPPIITPPATQSSARHPQIGLGVPNNSARRLDEAMASDLEGLSVSVIESMRNAMELLADMLQAVNPSDRMSVKDEVIIDLADRCRSNQKKLMQMLTTTMDEELLGQGLELNDAIQLVLAKNDAIASGFPLPTHLTSSSSSLPNESPASNIKPSGSRTGDSSPATNAKPSTPSVDNTKSHAVEEEEEDDEFAQLARRHSRPSPVPARGEDGASSSSSSGATLSSSAAPESAPSNALVLADAPPVKTTKEQDMADFLSIVLSTNFATDPEPTTQTPTRISAENYLGNHVQPTFNSYVVPWAQAQGQPQIQPQPQPQSQLHSLSQSQQQRQQMEAHFQPQQQYSSAYPPPPWAATPEYANGQTTTKDQYVYSMPQENNYGSMPTQGIRQYSSQSPQPVNGGVRSLQHSTSFQYSQSANHLGYSASQATMNPSSAPMAGRSLQHMISMPARGGISGGGAAANDSAATNTPMGQKPYIPSYRLFEDLNVFGNTEGKMRSGPYSSASGSSGQSMVGGRR